MVGKVVAKQRLESIVSTPRPSSKAVPVTRRAVESTEKKGEVGLADLRDVDKAKVARLINHVMVALKEIQRLKELLELERSNQAALVTKLQQQNQEVAAELRLKLASLQLLSPSQKVYLHAGRRPSLSPIKEAECSEAESEVTRCLVPESNAEMKSILTDRDNHITDFTVTAGGKDKCVSNKSEEGTKHYHENVQTGECEAFYSEANISEGGGKENKDPETLLHPTSDTLMANEGDATVLRKRPAPRPLPDLLSNILHRCKDFGVVSSADQSNSSVKSTPKLDALSGSLPVVQGTLKPTVSLPHAQLFQASRNSCSLDLEYMKQLSEVGTNGGRARHDLSVDICGDRLGCTYDVPCAQTAVSPVATLEEGQGKASVDLGGASTRLEAEGKESLGCKHLEGGKRCEALSCVLHSNLKCTAFHQCLTKCQRRLSSNLTNVICPEVLDRQEKVHNDSGTHEDHTEAHTSPSKKKLRFDPTAGEEGAFYYVSDIEKTVKGQADTGSFQPAIPGDTQGLRVGGESEQEGHRLDKETIESRWTPEAIERRNSFHRIPVILNGNEGHADEHSSFSEVVRTGKLENEVGREVRSTGEQEQLPISESEVFSIRNENSYFSKLRQSSQKTSKCINCTSFVSPRSRKALLSSDKLFAKYQPRCTKCSSIVQPKLSMHRVRENETCGGSTKSCNKCSFKGQQDRQNLGSSVETHVCGTEDDFQRSGRSTRSSSGNMARSIKCTTRLKPRAVRPLPQKPRRGPVGIRSDTSADGDESDPASVVYCDPSEDMYMSTNSSTDYSLKARKYVPTFPLKTLCRIHTRKIEKQSRSRRQMTSVKLLSDHSSAPTPKVYQMNGEILDMLIQSDGKYTGQLKTHLADSTGCRIETWKFGKSHKSSRKESTESRLDQRSKASSGIARHGQLVTDLDSRRGLTLSCDARQRGRPYDQGQGRKHSSEKWKRFEVDDLLDRFIQSNAECAAELIKCSVYFESTSSRPSSQSNLVSEKATEDYTASKLPFQISSAPEQGTEKCIVSPERVQRRTEVFRVDQSGSASAQPYPETCMRCSKCGVFIKPGRVIPPSGSIKMVERLDLRDLCQSCLASATAKKINVVRRSAVHGAEENRQAVNVAPPIVLPRVNSDDTSKIYEAGDPQKSFLHPSSSKRLICNVKNPGDWVSVVLQDPPDLSSDDHRMPIITGVSVSSRRSTPPREIEGAETTKELTEMFDMSLYDLVNDLEGQRRDYWRRVNSNTLDEKAKCEKRDSNRRRMVDVEKVHRSFTTRRQLPRKQVDTNHFR